MSSFIRDQVQQALTGDAAQVLPILDGVLTKFTPGTPTPGEASKGTNPTPTTYPMRCFMKAMDGDIDGTVIRQDDRMISIIGGELPDGVIPEVNDKIEIDGLTYRIVGGSNGIGVKWSGSRAMFRCHGRR